MESAGGGTCSAPADGESRPEKLLQSLVQGVRHHLLALHADGLVEHFPAAEDEEGGDGHDAVALRDLRAEIHVQLAHLRLPGKIGGQLLHGGGHHLAGAAPVGVEINQHWHL